MLESRPVDTIMAPCAKLNDLMQEDPTTFTLVYQEGTGALRYLAGKTKHDICYAVNVLASVQAWTTNNHCRALKRILWYFSGTETVRKSIDSVLKNPKTSLVAHLD